MPREVFSEDVWDEVRAAYMAGMTALECHKRFGPKVATIRRRVDNEGWRRDPLPARPTLDEAWHEEGGDGSEPEAVAPELAVERGMAQASAALAAGRAADALALLKATDQLARLAGREVEPSAPADPAPANPREVWRELTRSQRRDAMLEDVLWLVQEEADKMAREMLTDRPYQLGQSSLFGYHWRARTLGAEVAEADYLFAVASGWAAHLWDETGALRPLPEPYAPDERMWRQHMNSCAWRKQRDANLAAGAEPTAEEWMERTRDDLRRMREEMDEEEDRRREREQGHKER